MSSSHLTPRSQDASDSGGNNVIVLAHLLHIGYVQTQTHPQWRHTPQWRHRHRHTHTHLWGLFVRHMIPLALNIDRSTAHKATTRQLAQQIRPY